MKKLNPLFLTRENVIKSNLFQGLKNKTQMIRNKEEKDEFTNRIDHTKAVEKTCFEIVKLKHLEDFVCIDRLKLSALLHDIGHTPFGHAGENAINAMFLSDDGVHYSETFPGIFKHNINSIKLISERYILQDDQMVLIDSILKHSSVFTKDYNFLVFTENNVAKINFILRKCGFNNSPFFNDFINKYNELKCVKKCINIQNQTNICYCKNLKKNCYKQNLANKDFHISQYLYYSSPLTVEGTVLYWADEISCFISDFFDFLKYIVKYEKNISNSILVSSVTKNIRILQTINPNNFLLKSIIECIELAKDNDELGKKIIKISNKLDVIKTNLINSLYVDTTILNSGIILKENCEKIFTFKNKEDLDIFASIKKSIYNDIHKLKYIDDSNIYGSIAIKVLCKYYSNNFHQFLIDYGTINKLSVDSIAYNFSLYLNNLINQEEVNEANIKDFLLSIKSIKFSKKLMEQKIKIKNEKYKIMIKNFLKRETCYFVATLNEKQLLGLLKEHKKTVSLPNIEN